MNSPAQFPTQPIEADYLLGVGDELTLIQLNEVAGGLGNIISNIPQTGNDENNRNAAKPQSSENVLKTSGLVGTNGNILLLGLGSIKAEGRSLSDVQTEVRNILIRNGLAPSFQLEITSFNSKKAFVTFPNPNKNLGNNIVPITNLPITLKELAITYGLRPSSKDSTIVSLTRDGQKFRMTAGQLFDKTSPRIVIKDRDQIEIDEAASTSTSIEAVVGSRGNILIRGVGSLKAKNRSLTEVQAEITRILMDKGLTPNFQLEVTGYKSKEFFLITKMHGSKAIPISDSAVNLKQAVLSNIAIDNQTTNRDGATFTTVKLIRDGISYQVSWQELLSGSASNVLIKDGDIINLQDFDYKLGQVFALGGAGNAELVPIDPSKRETLADILFSPKGALNNILAKRSEVYLLRGRNPSVAYHLDAQNVSRILVAAQTELRPNDIVYVADRPIISFSRTLAEINPLRILLRDLENGDIP
jgi:polysaccharide export outer membrane protein